MTLPHSNPSSSRSYYVSKDGVKGSRFLAEGGRGLSKYAGDPIHTTTRIFVFCLFRGR